MRLGKRGSQVEPRPLLGATWLTSSSSENYMIGSERNNNGCSSCGKRWRGNLPKKPSMGVCARRHVTCSIASWRTPTLPHLPPLTGPFKASQRLRSYSHHVGALYHRGVSHPQQTSGAPIMRRCPAGQELGLLTLGDHLMSLGGTLSFREGGLSPSLTHQREHPRCAIFSETTTNPKGSTTVRRTRLTP
jgi:hypothetical protein